MWLGSTGLAANLAALCWLSIVTLNNPQFIFELQRRRNFI